MKYQKKKLDQSFYKTFFSMYIVLVLQNIVTLSVNLADNMMLVAYSEISLSGVAAVNQIQFVYQQLLGAFGDGLVVLCSQYWGRRQTGPNESRSDQHLGNCDSAFVLYGVCSGSVTSGGRVLSERGSGIQMYSSIH